MSIDAFSKIFVFSDKKEVVLELLSKGRELADHTNSSLVSIVFEEASEAFVRDNIVHGADQVLVVNDESSPIIQVEQYKECLLHVVDQYKPDVLLIGATRLGSELAARLAQKLGVGCASGCVSVELQGSSLIFERTYYGGRFLIRQMLTTKPIIATISPKTFEMKMYGEKRIGERIQIDCRTSRSRTRIVRVREKVTENVELEKAEVIVAAGRGVKAKEDLEMIRELAKALKGEIAGSRPITDDFKWLPADVQIGLTGHRVKPKLYIACGISGQTQHIVGIKDSKIIVAINIDAEAPIMQESDYCIPADIYRVVPALAARARQIREGK